MALSVRALIACVGVGFSLATPFASAGASVDLVPLAYHPYPDAADPLGLPSVNVGGTTLGYFETHYAFYDAEHDGFDFPSVVVDGVDFLGGAPGGAYDATLASYRNAFDARHVLESPFTLTVRSKLGPASVDLDVEVRSAAPMDEKGLVLKWALAEDDVAFRPPPALSNGVFVHRFTARSLQGVTPGPLDLSTSTEARYHDEVDLDASWDRDKLYFVVWVQNEDDTSRRFAFQEVPQATMHFVRDVDATTQDHKAVLMEMFTATWCAACLFGDSALHTLATEQGFRSTAYVTSSWTYVREPDLARVAGGAALGLVVAALVLGPRGAHRMLAGRTRKRQP